MKAHVLKSASRFCQEVLDQPDVNAPWQCERMILGEQNLAGSVVYHREALIVLFLRRLFVKRVETNRRHRSLEEAVFRS